MNVNCSQFCSQNHLKPIEYVGEKSRKVGLVRMRGKKATREQVNNKLYRPTQVESLNGFTSLFKHARENTNKKKSTMPPP